VTRGRSRTGRWARKRLLGLTTAGALLLLAAAWLAALEHTRPHVDGRTLRYDTLIEFAREGRLLDSTLLNYDSYVVGRYWEQPGRPASYRAAFLKAYDRGGVNTQQQLVDRLSRNGVPTTIDQQVSKGIAGVLIFVFPGFMTVIAFLYLIASWRLGRGLFAPGQAGRRVDGEQQLVTFADVAGQDAAVAELREIADYLTEPERFGSLGARIPGGVLVYGPPGSGKTLLARALAGEAGAAFHYVSGGEFVEMFAGVGASRIRDLFREVRETAPSILFIDELDAVGGRRDAGGSASPADHEREQALNQLLTEMDGFVATKRVVVVGATNRPDVLDPALLRPGRFDRSVGLAHPDDAGRLAILQVHARSRVLEGGADLAWIARRAVGMTGADLANLLNEAGLLAGRAGRRAIGQEHLEAAMKRIREAPERQRRLALRSRSPGRQALSDEQVTFDDLAGVDDVLRELADVRDFLEDPERFARLGARPPRGLLLSGPPGCGKTLAARALATEANAAFLWISASELTEIYVGEGAGRVRDLFAEARAAAPSIIFIDELDAVGGQRGRGLDGGSQERDTTLNQLLVELDGFGDRMGVVVMAATNRPELLDSALVRRGRFDRSVVFSLPDRAARRAILSLHARGKPLALDEADLDRLAEVTPGFSGADLAGVLNEAALLAARRRFDAIDRRLLDEALDRVERGAAQGHRITGEDRKIVAYHEAGHAIVALARGLPAPHRVTIMPRGSSLGAVSAAGSEDRSVRTRARLMDRLAFLLGGRAAEELVFGDASSGAMDDLAQVGGLAHRMVREWGMGETLGAQAVSGNGDQPSQDMAQRIDADVASIIQEAEAAARAAVAEARPALDSLASALVQEETVDARRLASLTNGLGGAT
jgi:cell division protease FtsH